MFTFTVTPDEGEPFEIVAASRDIVLWERVHRDNSLKKLESNLRMTDMYALCHVAAKRQGLYTGTLNDFIDSHDLEPETDEEQESGPTDPDR